MKEYEITIWIDEDGQIEADAEGFEGGACLEELEALLEGQPAIQEIEKKSEFDASPSRRTRPHTISQKEGS